MSSPNEEKDEEGIDIASFLTKKGGEGEEEEELNFDFNAVFKKKDEGEEYEFSDEEVVSDEEWIKKGILMADIFEQYCLHRFGPSDAERLADLHVQLNICLDGFDSIPLEKRQTKYERAMYEYLRGRLLDAIPVYKEEAMNHLSRAVMLKSTNADAWRCLANCLMKKGDYKRAQKEFKIALTMYADKRAEYQLSKLERMLAKVPGAENPAEHIAECIKHAKEAVNLDDKDGYCWYTLGRAYVESFFLTGEWDHEKLLQAIDAFEKAKTDRAMKLHPYLLYDYAIVNTYLEKYDRALADFDMCASRYPVLDAAKNVNMMIRLLDKVDELLQVQSNDKSKGKNKGKGKGKNKGKIKGKSEGTSLDALTSSLATIDLNPSYERANLDLLSEGLNKVLAVVGIVLHSVKNEKEFPLYYVFCDSEQNHFVVTVHGIRNEAIKQGDQVTLLEPYCNFIDFEWKGKRYQFKSVRVNLLEQVLVNGKPLPPNLAIREPIRKPTK